MCRLGGRYCNSNNSYNKSPMRTVRWSLLLRTCCKHTDVWESTYVHLVLFVNFVLMIQDGHFSSGLDVCTMVSFVAVCCNHKVGIAFQILTLGLWVSCSVQLNTHMLVLTTPTNNITKVLRLWKARRGRDEEQNPKFGDAECRAAKPDALLLDSRSLTLGCMLLYLLHCFSDRFLVQVASSPVSPDVGRMVFLWIFHAYSLK